MIETHLISLIIVEFSQIKPMTVAVWCGDGKPTNLNGFLGSFVTELNELLRNGIRINNSLITITIRCFICDSPARAFIKGRKTIVHFNYKP